MRYLNSVILFSAFFIIMCWGCNNAGNENKQAATVSDTAINIKPTNVPAFNADSAYTYVGTQVAFGPRTPGSEAQKKCAAWMGGKLKEVCDTVYTQQVQVTGGDGKSLPCINLIGVINPKAAKRILFLTHWDSRPWADQDTKDTNKPILAADDGGSGVGVLLEMARDLKIHGLPANI